MKTGIQKVVEHFGGQALLATRLGITQQAVSVWVKVGYIPADKLNAVWLEVKEDAKEIGIFPTDLLSPELQRLVRVAGGAV